MPNEQNDSNIEHDDIVEQLRKLGLRDNTMEGLELLYEILALATRARRLGVALDALVSTIGDAYEAVEAASAELVDMVKAK